MAGTRHGWIGLVLCLVSFACDVDDEAERASLVAIAEVEWSDAFAAMGACEMERVAACAEEVGALVAASEALAAASGEDAVTFRFAGATADCGGGVTVKCSGAGSCNGIDGVGCLCWGEHSNPYYPGNIWLTDYKPCPEP